MDTLSAEDARIAWDRVARGHDRHVTHTRMWAANEALRRAGLRPDMRFLDVAAGSGALSIPAARLGADVLATDLSRVMLDLLDQRAGREGLKIETRVMDGHALDIDDNSFDMVGSQFGVMLFPDMPRGIGEMVRVVKPSGHVLMNVLGDPRKVEFFAFFARAIQAVRPDFSIPLDPPPLPFELQEHARLRQELVAAGLKDVRIDSVAETLEFRSGRELWEWLLSSNPIAEMVLGEMHVTDAEGDEIEQALERLVRERAGGNASAVLSVPINIGIGAK